jgi:mono/diheme cytochrome c family protein
LDTEREIAPEGQVEEEPAPAEKKKGRGCVIWVIVGLVVLALLGGGAMVGAQTLFRTESPLPLEREIADLGKRLIMVPGEFQDRRIPNRLAGTPEQEAALVERGKKLFLEGDIGARGDGAMSCALCHGQAGYGDTNLGANMYPPASNLASASTQGKTDGQLFWLIAHGINLTGMPAFGKGYGPSNVPEAQRGGPYTEDEIWSLVAYINTLK